MISTITSTQVYKQISPIVRESITHLFIYGLNKYNDLDSIVEDLSAIYDKKKPFHKYSMKQLAKVIVSYMQIQWARTHEHVHEPIQSLLKSELNMFSSKLNCFSYMCVYIYIYIYIVTTFTNSEGLVITYTSELL